MLKCSNDKIFTELLQVKIEAVPVYNNFIGYLYGCYDQLAIKINVYSLDFLQNNRSVLYLYHKIAKNIKGIAEICGVKAQNGAYGHV